MSVTPMEMCSVACITNNFLKLPCWVGWRSNLIVFLTFSIAKVPEMDPVYVGFKMLP
jgi:hypothetical protein